MLKNSVLPDGENIIEYFKSVILITLESFYNQNSTTDECIKDMIKSLERLSSAISNSISISSNQRCEDSQSREKGQIFSALANSVSTSNGANSTSSFSKNMTFLELLEKNKRRAKLSPLEEMLKKYENLYRSTPEELPSRKLNDPVVPITSVREEKKIGSFLVEDFQGLDLDNNTEKVLVCIKFRNLSIIFFKKLTIFSRKKLLNYLTM